MDEPSGDIVTELAKQRLITVDRSPEQLRAASGLRWMRYAVGADLVGWIPAAVIAVGGAFASSSRVDHAAALNPLAFSLLLWPLSRIAFALGLWRLGGLSRVRRPARASFWCFMVADLALALSFGRSSLRLVQEFDAPFTAWLPNPAALYALCAYSIGPGILLWALVVAARSVAASLPLWALLVEGLGVAVAGLLSVMGSLLPTTWYIESLGSPWFPTLGWTLLGLYVGGLIAQLALLHAAERALTMRGAREASD